MAPGYTAKRVQVGLMSVGSASPLAACAATVYNPGAVEIVAKFQQTSVEGSGPYTTLGGAFAIQPGGMVKRTFTPTEPLLELKSLLGSGRVHVELTTGADMNEFGTSEDVDPTIPQSLWSANPAPPTPHAVQEFASNTVWVVTHNLGFVASPTLLNSAGVDITALATFSSVSPAAYTATFGSAQAGRAISTQ